MQDLKRIKDHRRFIIKYVISINRNCLFQWLNYLSLKLRGGGFSRLWFSQSPMTYKFVETCRSSGQCHVSLEYHVTCVTH